MKFRTENSKHDRRVNRAFNLACQIVARAAIGLECESKHALRAQIRERLGLDVFTKKDDPRILGDRRATGDAAHLLGLSRWWQKDEELLFLNSPVVGLCCRWLERSGGSVDMFELPFITKRDVKIGRIRYQLGITRLEDNLIAGCVFQGKDETWFFAGKERLYQFGVFMNEATIRKVLAEHHQNIVSVNPTSSPLTKEAAEYVSKLTRKSHLRYPCIRSRKFLVSATIINRELLSPADLASLEPAVAKLNEWAEGWAAKNGFFEHENFNDLIRRTFGE